VGSTEGKVYTVCWWAEQRERCMECVGGQNWTKVVESVLLGRIVENFEQCFGGHK